MSIFKNKFTILILGIAAVLILGGQGVSAQDKPSVFVFPASLTKNVGNSFDLAVKVDPAGQKVCAVEGQLALSKFVVQKVNIADGIISQTPPSFSNGFYFLLGIPGCTTQDKTLFTIEVKANAIGQAGVSFKKVDIIGEGESLSSNFSEGSYEIIIPETPAIEVKNQETGITKPCICENWSSWHNKGCGEGGCLDTQRLQIRDRNCNPSGCDIEEQTQCVNDSQCISRAKEPSSVVSTKENEKERSLLAAIGNIFSFGTGNILVEILAIVLVFAATMCLLWFLLKKRKKSN